MSGTSSNEPSQEPKTESSSTTSGSSTGTSEPRPTGGLAQLKSYVVNHSLDTALWATRALTLMFCLSYLLPFFSSAYSSYHKALLSNAATSALRLYQRIPNIHFTREFLVKIFMEDSAHYLFYSVIFMYSQPLTMVLVPIFLFALLHFASFSLGLLDACGHNNALGSRFLISLVEFQQCNMLRGAAFVEIFLMPLTAISLFMGRVGLLTPFLYYRFLSLRYSSRRNSYTRSMFYELRVTAEYTVNRPSMPSFIRNAVYKAITFTSGLAPTYVQSGAE